MKRIILGSGSPRRKELLSGLGIDFTVDTGNTFEETMEAGVPACEIPAMMSRGKSNGFHRALEADEILITADTIVIVDGKPIGKPHSMEEAREMLRTLSGRSHEVITAVTIRDSRRETTFSDLSTVTFATLSEDEICKYVEEYKPLDKAGAYGIQEWVGYAGISRVEGSFYNVMGLPTHKVHQELKSFL